MTSKLLLYIFITTNLLLSLIINTNCAGKNIRTDKDKTASVKIAYSEHVQFMIKQLTLHNKTDRSKPKLVHEGVEVYET